MHWLPLSFLSAIRSTGYYLQSPVWHRAWITERPLSPVVSTLPVHSSRMDEHQGPFIKCGHLVGLRKHAFSGSNIIDRERRTAPSLLEFWKVLKTWLWFQSWDCWVSETPIKIVSRFIGLLPCGYIKTFKVCLYEISTGLEEGTVVVNVIF